MLHRSLPLPAYQQVIWPVSKSFLIVVKKDLVPISIWKVIYIQNTRQRRGWEIHRIWRVVGGVGGGGLGEAPTKRGGWGNLARACYSLINKTTFYFRMKYLLKNTWTPQSRGGSLFWKRLFFGRFHHILLLASVAQLKGYQVPQTSKFDVHFFQKRIDSSHSQEGFPVPLSAQTSIRGSTN